MTNKPLSKIISVIITIFTCIVFSYNTDAQNIVKIEYSINSNPAYGFGTDIPVTSAPNILNQIHNIDLNLLNNGFNYVYIRAKDENGIWSQTTVLSIFKESFKSPLADIVEAEYFLNNDPGYGNATSISLIPGQSIPGIAFNVDINSLSIGFHYLYIRAKDSNGLWSHVSVVSFYKDNIIIDNPDIVKAEYFINTDPGIGNAIDIPVTSGPMVSNINFNADISSLSNGFHNIYLRAKNSKGRWSLTNIKSFLKETIVTTPFNIVKAEYFFNNDPGLGNGTDIPIVPGIQIAGISFNADINSLGKGFHNLYCRVKNSEGHWSLTNIRSFYIDEVKPEGNIVAAEYFFNNDPGLGNGISIPVTPGNPLVAINVSANINSLSNGFNHLYLRAKDINGKWSLTNIVAFYKDAIDNSLANIVAAEYFFNTDPGIGNGNPISVAPGQNINVLAGAPLSELSTQGVNRLYIRTKDAKGKWSHTNIIYFTIDHLVTLLADPAAGGQTIGGGWYSNNYELTIKATSNLGFIFLNWSEGGVFLSNLPEYTIFVDSHKTITANFEEFEIKPGDVNNDGLVNVLDMVWLISHILGETPGGFNYFNADVNSDGEINVADLSALIYIIIEL